jgi:hypothetical protein
LREPFSASEDFFHEDRNVAWLARRRFFGNLFAQASEVCERIAQAINVVDAKTVNGRLRS